MTVTGDASANFNFKLDNFSQSLSLTWVPEVRFFGADYAFVIEPSWGYVRTHVKATADANCIISVGNISKSLSVK